MLHFKHENYMSRKSEKAGRCIGAIGGTIAGAVIGTLVGDKVAHKLDCNQKYN